MEFMIDLSAQSDTQVYMQPLVNESREDVLRTLRRDATAGAFFDSGVQGCREMGSSTKTHLLHHEVNRR